MNICIKQLKNGRNLSATHERLLTSTHESSFFLICFIWIKWCYPTYNLPHVKNQHFFFIWMTMIYTIARHAVNENQFSFCLFYINEIWSIELCKVKSFQRVACSIINYLCKWRRIKVYVCSPLRKFYPLKLKLGFSILIMTHNKFLCE